MLNEEYNNSYKFMEAVAKVVKGLKKGQKKEFTCPLCGRQAFVGIAAYNGHVHARCDCGIVIIQ